jgi:hexosaminidase
MYSPLTLFADACSADASDAYDFSKVVEQYNETKSLENQIAVTNYLRKWITMNSDLIALSANAPLVQPILPLSKSLSDLSKQLLLVIEEKQPVNKTIINDLFEKINNRNSADVELAVYSSLKKLL